MLKINYMSTLFVGIDVNSKSDAVYIMDFEENKCISSSFSNNQPDADKLVNMIAECIQKHKNLDMILIVLEASSFNCIHAYQKEIKLIEQAIEKYINGINANALAILQPIPGIDPI